MVDMAHPEDMEATLLCCRLPSTRLGSPVALWTLTVQTVIQVRTEPLGSEHGESQAQMVAGVNPETPVLQVLMRSAATVPPEKMGRTAQHRAVLEETAGMEGMVDRR